MSSAPARLLLWLALLGALWQPLCECRGVWKSSASAPASESCCAGASEAPRPDPCDRPGNACECGHHLVLGASDGDGASDLVRLPALAALSPHAFELRTLVLPPLARPAPRPAPPRPPDLARLLPLRI